MMNVFTLEIDPREIKLLETNARYMKHEEFNRLVENIRRDGKLTSTPFLCKDDDDRWLFTPNAITPRAKFLPRLNIRW